MIDKSLFGEYNNYCTVGKAALEKYSRGRRGAPAKGVGRSRGAKVQIPPSPFRSFKNF